MSKSPHTTEWKIEIIKKYMSGEGSYESISGMGTKPETIAPKAISTRAQLAKIMTDFLVANE